MKLNHFAYIFLGAQLDPKQHRMDMVLPQATFTTIGIDFNHKEQVVAIALELVSEGVQVIELCGGFGPLWIAKVAEATEHKIPVGSVAYGPEARQPMLDLLRDE